MSVYICRSIAVDHDSRAQRYVKVLLDAGYDIKIIQWGGEKSMNVYTAPILRVRDYPALNFFLTPLFCVWLFFLLVVKLSRHDQVLAIDLDVALPIFFASKFKRFKYFFDIADPYSLCRFNRRIKIVDWLEGLVANKASLAILPAICRREFYSQKTDFCIIENVPIINETSSINIPAADGMLHVGYFGNLEPNHRGLELLVKVVLARADIVLHIGGAGGLSEFFIQVSKDNPEKIIFYGKFSPHELPNLASRCQLMFAFYSLSKEHHKYVAANKLYEHLYLGIPLLTNQGTNFADDIFKWNTGWSVSESDRALHEFFNCLVNDKSILHAKSKTALELWRGLYSGYWAESEGVKRFVSSLSWG